MQTKPLKRYRKPQYPTRLEVLRRPELLREHVPPSWRRAEMAGAVALMLAVNGCTDPRQSGGSTSGPPRTAALVAPVFEHGAGRGVAGCVVLAPPVFLSEEEASQVILHELLRSGIEIARTNVELASVPVKQGPHRMVRGDYPEWAAEMKPLEADGLTADGKVAFEFISEADYFHFRGRDSWWSVVDYDLVATARSLAQQVGENGTQVWFGTFYDPMQRDSGRDEPWEVRLRQTHEDRVAATREEAKRLLREQVVDFVHWLKGQGAI